MAARRLLIVMVILLTISTLAAALVPPPPEREETSTTSTSTTTTTGDRPARDGRLVRETISISRSGERAPLEVAARVGDQLALVVESDAPGEVSIPAYGLIEFAGPGDPARFDVLLEEPGRYKVRFDRRGEVARIVATRKDEPKPDRS
jgi:hypothetical protein